MSKPLRKKIIRKSLNSIFIVGEVVDVGFIPKGKGINVRARIKMRPNSNSSSFVYLDVFGRKSCYEVMTLVCQNGNIVYIEGEFRNKYSENNVAKPYVLVTHIECLLRRKEVVPPSPSIIKLLDDLDPIGYVPNVEVENAPSKKKK